MLPTVEPFLPPSLSGLYLLDDVDEWHAWLICLICQLEVEKCSISEHRPLYHVLTLLLGEMLDVARYGPL
jgi:hypothetical protein